MLEMTIPLPKFPAKKIETNTIYLAVELLQGDHPIEEGCVVRGSRCQKVLFVILTIHASDTLEKSHAPGSKGSKVTFLFDSLED